MQELDRILLAVSYSSDLNKENVANKIRTEIDTKLKEENLDEQTKKDLEECFKQWKEDNFDLKKFPYGSLLQLAAKLNCAKLAKALIESGIDVNDGFPLHCAAERGHVQVAEILLAAKADVNMHDQYKLTPLDYAVELGNKIEMVKLLLKKGATNVPNQYGQTPLHYAAERGHVQTVETLLKEGNADVDLQDKNGKTPLHRATGRKGEHIQVVAILLQEKAKVNLQDKEGKTSLHYAAENEYTQIAEALLKKGADVNVQDKDGRTPLYYAVYYTMVNTQG
ncbi:ankyrin repeat domain-containing protein [Wolbachia endosymbiont of Cimex lectularius]|uniref:ankyrin repeat domain-containing protein n=1 Tax=Wolbachia endosymbiont of Cimex lectularius TaxID=246273 RepID=UPI0011AEC0AA|nr:ankyrin repeat domain-containing protein [Wolbachia endosymbiont of Cimex lectularius]